MALFTPSLSAIQTLLRSGHLPCAARASHDRQDLESDAPTALLVSCLVAESAYHYPSIVRTMNHEEHEHPHTHGRSDLEYHTDVLRVTLLHRCQCRCYEKRIALDQSGWNRGRKDEMH